MHPVGVISFIYVRIRLIWNWLVQELAERSPPITKMVLQHLLSWYNLPDMGIMFFKPFTQRSAVLPIACAVVLEDKDQSVRIREKSLQVDSQFSQTPKVRPEN